MTIDAAPAAAPELEAGARAQLFAALADPTRLAIVDLLREHAELAGHDLAERLGISRQLLCHHNRILVDCGLVRVRREGKHKLSSLDRERLRALLAELA